MEQDPELAYWAELTPRHSQMLAALACLERAVARALADLDRAPPNSGDPAEYLLERVRVYVDAYRQDASPDGLVARCLGKAMEYMDLDFRYYQQWAQPDSA